MDDSSQSEVARIRAQIAEEYEAARRGLTGLASGPARHNFITRKMERLGQLHQELGQVVGEQQATEIVVQTMSQLPHKKKDDTGGA